jgi:hypothetical protein
MCHLFLLHDGKSIRGVACGFFDMSLLPLEGDGKVNNRLPAADLEQERRRQQIQRLSHRLSFFRFCFASFTSRLYSKMSSSSFLSFLFVFLLCCRTANMLKFEEEKKFIAVLTCLFSLHSFLIFRRQEIESSFSSPYYQHTKEILKFTCMCDTHARTHVHTHTYTHVHTHTHTYTHTHTHTHTNTHTTMSDASMLVVQRCKKKCIGFGPSNFALLRSGERERERERSERATAHFQGYAVRMPLPPSP